MNNEEHDLFIANFMKAIDEITVHPRYSEFLYSE
jgi:hypothetical protein